MASFHINFSPSPTRALEQKLVERTGDDGQGVGGREFTEEVSYRVGRLGQ